MNLFQRYLVEEFAEDYQEGRISRREALKLIASITGSILAASTILAACTTPEETAAPTDPQAQTPTRAEPATQAPPTPTEAMPATAAPSATLMAEASDTPEVNTTLTPSPAVTVDPNDAEIEAGDVEFTGDDGSTLLGYQARPAGEGPFAVVLVCHENRGLTTHIQDVTRRLAKAGYAALAVDLLARQGGTAALGSDQIPGALGNTPPDQFVQDFLSGWHFMGSQPGIQAERVGMVGFCFGGGVTWRMATHMPELRAAVPFYGPHPPVEDIPKIQAAVLAIYAERDQRINSGIPPIEEAMQQHNKIYEKIIYPGTDHAFHNDTGSRYNAQAAQDAWQKTLDWFEKYLT